MRSILLTQPLLWSLLLALSGCKDRAPDALVLPAASPGDPHAAAGQTFAAAHLQPGGALPSGGAAAGPAEIVFSELPGGVAQVVEKGGRFLVVHNGRAGRAYAAVGEPVLSRDGRRCAHGALVDGKWRMVVDGREGRVWDTVRAPVFSADGAHLAYQAMDGEVWRLVVDGKANAGTRTRFLEHAFVAGASRIAFVDDVDDRERGRLVVSDLGFGHPVVVASGVSAMLVSPDGARLAAVAASEGRQRVLTLSPAQPDRVARGAPADEVFGLGFGPDGAAVTYVAQRFGQYVVVLEDREVAAGPVRFFAPPVVIPGGKGVGALVVSQAGSVLLQEYFGDRTPREPSYDEADDLVYDGSGRSRAYAARRGERWHAVVDGKEGPPFDRVIGPVFSPDGRHLAYRARSGGARFVVVADLQGGGLSVHGAHEQVFPVRFTDEGRSVAYGVKGAAGFGWVVEPR